MKSESTVNCPNYLDLSNSNECQEFAYVATKLAFKAGGYGSYTDVDQAAILGANSGLLNYIFGKDRQELIF